MSKNRLFVRILGVILSVGLVANLNFPIKTSSVGAGSSRAEKIRKANLNKQQQKLKQQLDAAKARQQVDQKREAVIERTDASVSDAITADTAELLDLQRQIEEAERQLAEERQNANTEYQNYQRLLKAMVQMNASGTFNVLSLLSGQQAFEREAEQKKFAEGITRLASDKLAELKDLISQISAQSADITAQRKAMEEHRRKLEAKKKAVRERNGGC